MTMSENLAVDVEEVAKRILGHKFLSFEIDRHEYRFSWADTDSPVGERSVGYPSITKPSQIPGLRGFLEAQVTEPRYTEY